MPARDEEAGRLAHGGISYGEIFPVFVAPQGEEQVVRGELERKVRLEKRPWFDLRDTGLVR